MLDLEVWLIGTRAEVDAAAQALAGIGCVLQRGDRARLTGTDAGRFRSYLRVRIATARTPQRQPNQQGHGDAGLIDLKTERATRRPA